MSQDTPVQRGEGLARAFTACSTAPGRKSVGLTLVLGCCFPVGISTPQHVGANQEVTPMQSPGGKSGSMEPLAAKALGGDVGAF